MLPVAVIICSLLLGGYSTQFTIGPRSSLQTASGRTTTDNKDMNMKQNIAILVVIGWS